MIDTQSDLNQLVSRLPKSGFIAIDTEADSLYSYPGKLCLIQVGLVDEVALIDPLAGLDLSKFISKTSCLKPIIHGCDYDLRLLNQSLNFQPTNVFDTMLAARLLGRSEFGLGSLVKQELDIELPKGSQKANWGKRPLTERMIEYAGNDVRYLHQVAEQLENELRSINRLEWHLEWCQRYAEIAQTDNRPDPDLVWRLKGSHKLEPRQLAVLRAVWEWREIQAIAGNKPPYFVLAHERLIELAKYAFDDEVEVQLPPRFSSARSFAIHEIVREAKRIPEEDCPQRKRSEGRRPTSDELKRFDQIQALRNRKSEELGIDPTIIASKTVLLRLARDWDTCNQELMKWQRDLLSGCFA